ncbi:MAG: hypothetical protein FE78DRAFT_142425 [Acidomyces sp. 'richmondensis']|nr:MAG: hypothetical protein FE78DRAFT_142425 [Acidomyces sp. 'richmondensis']
MRSSFLERILLLPAALLGWSVSHSLAHGLEARTTTVPAPISFAPDENWDGIDGPWSSFTLRIGTPQQFVRTFVSFQSYQTWAVLPQGCEAASDYSACAQQRGWIYNESASSTFDRIGIYDLYIEQNLGYEGNAIYGYDTVGLGGEGENGPTIENTTVGGFAVLDFYLGIFGINPKPTNFSSFNEPSPSYMTKLKEQNYIPSISAGYSAGAQYRFTGELATLTLGGYDTSKFVPNNVTFEFAVDNERDLVVAIQSITTPSKIPSSPAATELLPTPIYALLDTTVSQIWLPLEACRAFEETFGIVYDNATELYLVNETLHQQLTDQNPNITFTLAQGLSGGPTVQIELPYAAFDLTALPPYQGLANKTYYFPLRRAANESQYTIGRTFFQEAYLTVDWESERFNVSQCAWNQTAQSHIVAIPAYRGSSPAYISGNTLPGGGQTGDLSKGAIAGIVVGVVAGVAIFFCLVLWLWRRRSRAAKAADRGEKLEGDINDGDPFTRGHNTTVFPKAELEGNGHGTQASSVVLSPLSPSNTSEADSRERQIFEMAGDMPTIREKDGKALSEKEALRHREKVYNGVENPAADVHDGIRERRRINPENVVRADTRHLMQGEGEGDIGLAMGEPRDFFRHRAFSFEEERDGAGTESSDELYSFRS